MKRSSHAAQIQHNFDPDQILYLAGDVNYCTVYLLDGRAILSSRTLKWYSNRWPCFIRIHKGYLINPAYVHNCIVLSSILAYMIMHNGARLPIGRRRISQVIQELGFGLPAYGRTSSYLLVAS
ncbi:LytR/AlgR family response regulator transcription factor [Spirosoma foliorum]|uniref:LytTR family transcriptional regulator n=1 Tax=Spirosoma foliorum TaxID=2710596 RepID=A0A7G5GV09_9BACT|nr:LytTR family DNA-binding domain-containing protein [Spirosoma foliorum]QMW02701.1 LytTR family transcriptional regulator [Spirosoma foliorum]